MALQPYYFNNDLFKAKQIYSAKADVGMIKHNFNKHLTKHWNFKTPQTTYQSCRKIYSIFINLIGNLREYKNKMKTHSYSKTIVSEFIKLDLCRKFLQMGYSRSMRYYYHKNGRKLRQVGNKWQVLPYDYDEEKRESAVIFKEYLKKVNKNKIYRLAKSYYLSLPDDSNRVSTTIFK